MRPFQILFGITTNVLIQTVTLPSPMVNATLSYQYYYKNTYIKGFYPGLQFRVDILTSTASDFTLDPNDILATVFQTNQGDPLDTLIYLFNSFDMTPFWGQTIRIRFMSISSLKARLVFAVDDVQLIVSSFEGLSNLQGTSVVNKFLSGTDRVHILTWSPSQDPNIGDYHIYRDGVEIAVIPASGPYYYEDHNRTSFPETYTVTAFNVDHTQSSFETITLR